MAFIYRYHIKNKQIRDKVNLTKFRDDIIKTIKEFYKNNLKDCKVEEKYYEYKLHLSVDNQILCKFGKLLLQNSEELRTIQKSINKKNTAFFIRKMQEYYAFIYREENDVVSPIELIDVIDFNDLERFSSNAIEKLKNYLENYNVELTNNKNELNVLARVFYMDVFTLYMKKDDLEKHFECLKKDYNVDIVLVKGYHKRNFDENKIIAELDAEQLRNFTISDYIHDKKEEKFYLTDGFRILDTKELDKNKVKSIMNSLSIYIKQAKSINKFDGWNYKDVNFTVHNVGQALATSLSILKKPPFLYFDFGVSEGKNFFNIPKHMTIDVSAKPSIIISHIHRDHWYGITVFTESFECDWYIPNQYKGVLFKKRCGEIIASGGSVSYITTPITSSLGTVFIGGKSKHKATRLPKHKHDKGLGMKIKLFSKKMIDVNILVPGDQRYDYIPSVYLKKIDILVASHHGGEYSWSKRKNVYQDIPHSSIKSGQIIYSYGENNTHHHPSRVEHYERQGWTVKHDTVIDADFKFK